MTTACIGPICETGCSEFVEIAAFPMQTAPITHVQFYTDNVDGTLRDIAVRVGQVAPAQSICASHPDNSKANVVELEVKAPIVGFEYTQDTATIRSMRLIQNSCSLNGLSAFELSLGDVPEPIMI